MNIAAVIAFVRAWWRPLLVALALVVVGLSIHHYGAQRFDAGYAKATREDAAALAKQIHDASIKETADALRLQRANDDLQTTRSELARLRAQPVRHILCHAAPDSGRVPEAAGLSAAAAPSPGPLPGGAAESARPEFDPTDKLIALADEADELLANCRWLHQAVHGIPSTLPARIPPH